MALNFSLKKKPTPGCRYVVVRWTRGSQARTRQLVSCHRTAKAARAALGELRGTQAKANATLLGKVGKTFGVGSKQGAAYDLKTGKRLKV